MTSRLSMHLHHLCDVLYRPGEQPLAARIADSFGYKVTWASWMEATIVPGLVSLLVVPWVVMKLNPPRVLRTPEASALRGASELSRSVRSNSAKKFMTIVFIFGCGLW